MPLKVELSISDDVESEVVPVHIPDSKDIELWAQSACLGDDDFVASMQVVSRNEMQTLNRTYRDQDKPTNVLSFPMDLPGELDIPLLGDLALCADVINAEADQQNKHADAHWAHMIVHGMLHLQGYDHVDDEEAELMEATEVSILNTLGFNNPYDNDE